MKIAKKLQVFSTKSDLNFYNFEISILIKRFKTQSIYVQIYFELLISEAHVRDYMAKANY